MPIANCDLREIDDTHNATGAGVEQHVVPVQVVMQNRSVTSGWLDLLIPIDHACYERSLRITRDVRQEMETQSPR